MKTLLAVISIFCGLSSVKAFSDEGDVKSRKPATSAKAPYKSKKKPNSIVVTEAMLKAIGDENEQLANGSYGVEKYKAPAGKWSADDYKAAALENFNDWKERMNDTDCGQGLQLRGRNKIIAAIGKDEYTTDPDTKAKLTKLMKGHAIVAAFATVWDGSGDGAEACPVYYFDFYTNNGLRLTLHYDQGD